MTEDLAEALRAATADRDDGGPVLLVPWATAVQADQRGPGGDLPPLLDLYPGRTFRFCPNNQRQADLIVRCLAERDPRSLPKRVVLVVDPSDPYSVDLAACFRRAIGRVAPRAEIVEQPDAILSPGLAESPGLPEHRWAEEVWKTAQGEGPTHRRPTWVVLPLQGEPTRRMLAALRASAPAGMTAEDTPLRVVCGDGIGMNTLRDFAATGGGLSVWCVSSESLPEPNGQGIVQDGQVPAEIVSALALALDRTDGPQTLRATLDKLRLSARHPSAIGRSLAFDPGGERQGEDLGHVLMLRPDRNDVSAFARNPDASWSGPVLIPPVEVLARH